MGTSLDIAWPQRISSERLLLRPPRHRDRTALVNLVSDAQVYRHLGGPTPRAQAQAHLRGPYGKDVGTFTVADAESDAFLGLVRLDRHASTRPGHRDDPDVPATRHGEMELSYSLAVGAWGKGLALEATTAALAWVAPLVPDRHVIAVTQSANTRSVALLRRLGFVEREGFLEFGAEQTLQVLPLAVEPA